MDGGREKDSAAAFEFRRREATASIRRTSVRKPTRGDAPNRIGLDVLNLTADEFVESEQYWRNRSAPKTKIIPLRNSASLRVQNGALELTERLPLHLAPDGEPHVVRFNADEARRGRIPQLAPSMPRAIILPEHGWHVTAEAVKFCLVHNIASASVAARTTQGEKGLVSIVAGNPIADAALLRAEIRANPTNIARQSSDRRSRLALRLVAAPQDAYELLEALRGAFRRSRGRRSAEACASRSRRTRADARAIRSRGGPRCGRRESSD